MEGTEELEAEPTIFLAWILERNVEMPHDPMNLMEVTEMANNQSFHFVTAHFVPGPHMESLLSPL